MKLSIRRLGLGTLLLLAVLLVAIQLVPTARTNPPAAAPIRAPAEVDRILRRACFDCHSHETVWPWYTRVAPVSWYVAHEVEEGREELNFSEWGAMNPERRDHKLSEIVEEVVMGEMPPRAYLWMHGAARLDGEEIKILREWVRGETRRSGDETDDTPNEEGSE